MTGERPLVGVISDRRMAGLHPFHMAGEKYLQALVTGADVMPMSIPAEMDGLRSVDFLSRIDGLFLTGSPSNMSPHHYGGSPSKEGTWHDPERDTVALELIPEAISRGLPLLGVCRGFQELNVAFGGTLHQLVHEIPGFLTHKENPDDPLDIQYGPSHSVRFTPGGLLASVTGVSHAQVNSLHSQAIDRLGDGLDVEALAEDGLVEGIVVRDAPGFALGVQWHPEWQVAENAVSMATFGAFGNACRKYRKRQS
jgi:putative glutamine amidotransferase